MVASDTIRIVVTLKNGHQFEHHHIKDPEPKLLEFISEIIEEFTKPNKGILTLPSPYGIYDMNDISSILFPDLVSDEDKLPLGFHPTK